MYLKSVRFENIKAFDNITFEFGVGGKYAGWNVFVGGNASGKSTVLKGIALAIAGPNEGRSLIRNTIGWLRHESLKGSINAELLPEPVVDKVTQKGKPRKKSFDASIYWQRKHPRDIPVFRSSEKSVKIKELEKGLWDPNASGWFCAGYGPMRRLTGSHPDAVRDAVSGGIVSRMVTLFREDAALSESEEWLKKLYSRVLERNGEASEYKTLLEGVKAFLNAGLLPQSLQISKVTVDHILLKSPDGLELPMRDLSDGCRSVYAFILDLIHSFFDVYGTAELFKNSSEGYIQIDQPGIVLIDEVEAHLHPAWQQVLPEWLKTRFPRVQFIVTTHSPIIAQAADPGGIYVLPLQNESERAPRRLEDHEYQKVVLRQAEKSLLGEAFGLKTTFSKRANQLIEQWQRLNAKKQAGASLSTQENKDLKKLNDQMELIFEAPVAAWSAK